MKFAQIIDCKTERFDDMNRLMDRWIEQTKGKRTATHSLVGKDRDSGSHIVEIVEFPSYDEAMRNSQLPETDRIFQEMVALCDAMPTFTNLDVMRDDQLSKELVNRFLDEVVAEGHYDVVDEVFAEDYCDHDILRDEPTVYGRDVMRQGVKMWRGGFDFSLDKDVQLAEGDCVTTLWTWTGRHQGDFLGIPATGRTCTMTGSTTFRCKDGRIAEGWWHYDAMRLMRELGAMPG
ncbi:ester cyclase [Streptomyces sp. NPDC002004]